MNKNDQNKVLVLDVWRAPATILRKKRFLAEEGKALKDLRAFHDE